MTWNADAFFAIGKTHMVCQDYARTGDSKFPWLGPTPYAALSDGCSSSPDTDWGARLLVAAAERYLLGAPHHEPYKRFEPEILARADKAAYLLGLPRHCLDATLLTACYGKNEVDEPGVRVSLRGDGVIAMRRRNGHFDFYQVEHLRGAPFYLSYDMEPDRRDAYYEKFGDETTCRIYYSGFAKDRSRDGWIPEAMEKVSWHGDWFFRSADYDLVVLMSDGVASFQRAVETNTSLSFEAVPVEEVVAQILAIKGFAGSFIQRRCHKFLTKFCVENRWQHTDDFSAAAIWMGDKQ